jgi:hypothetical protein
VQVLWLIQPQKGRRVYTKERRNVRLQEVHRTRATAEFEGKHYRVLISMLSRRALVLGQREAEAA